MIGLDTNVLARYYVQDEADAEAVKQHDAAKRLIESGKPLMVCKTVLLELEWVMRGYYHFSPAEISRVMRHLMSLSHVVIEDKRKVEQAIAQCEAGLAFADVLHFVSYHACESMATFDDKKFAKRAKRLGLVPRIIIPE
ncbi:MAG TPA: type II toxin-antitoxin system VapC family toxin [Methylotenera sp.]|nr:type II toxin-antitoxin system VapC family toxin [Methylotenera sp.]HQO16739.1 type II toxin-antitoxin system VapC family toxin [Methylotenera sp.]